MDPRIAFNALRAVAQYLAQAQMTDELANLLTIQQAIQQQIDQENQA